MDIRPANTNLWRYLLAVLAGLYISLLWNIIPARADFIHEVTTGDTSYTVSNDNNDLVCQKHTATGSYTIDDITFSIKRDSATGIGGLNVGIYKDLGTTLQWQQYGTEGQIYSGELATLDTFYDISRTFNYTMSTGTDYSFCLAQSSGTQFPHWFVEGSTIDTPVGQDWANTNSFVADFDGAFVGTVNVSNTLPITPPISTTTTSTTTLMSEDLEFLFTFTMMMGIWLFVFALLVSLTHIFLNKKHD